METKDMLYIVTEYAKNGEMFGEFHVHLLCSSFVCVTLYVLCNKRVTAIFNLSVTWDL